MRPASSFLRLGLAASHLPERARAWSDGLLFLVG